MTTCTPPKLKHWDVNEEGRPASPEEVWEDLCHRIEWRDFLLRVATSSGPPSGGVPADEETREAWNWTKNRISAEWAAKQSSRATRRLIGAMERDQVRLAMRAIQIQLEVPATEVPLPFGGQPRRDRILHDYDYAEIERRLLNVDTYVALHEQPGPPQVASLRMRSSGVAMNAVTDEIQRAASCVEIQLPQPDTLRLGRVERAARFAALYGMSGGVHLLRNQTEVTEGEESE